MSLSILHVSISDFYPIGMMSRFTYAFLCFFMPFLAFLDGLKLFLNRLSFPSPFPAFLRLFETCR